MNNFIQNLLKTTLQWFTITSTLFLMKSLIDNSNDWFYLIHIFGALFCLNTLFKNK